MEPARHVIHYWLCDVFALGATFDTFSGRRGLHSWCYDERVLYWTREQRTAFVNRVTWSAALADTMHSPNIETILRATVPAKLVPDIAELTRAELFERFYPRFDVAITMDAAHLKGLPLSLHPATGFLRIPLPPLHNKGGHVFNLKDHCLQAWALNLSDVIAFTEGIIGQISAPKANGPP